MRSNRRAPAGFAALLGAGALAGAVWWQFRAPLGPVFCRPVIKISVLREAASCSDALPPSGHFVYVAHPREAIPGVELIHRLELRNLTGPETHTVDLGLGARAEITWSVEGKRPRITVTMFWPDGDSSPLPLPLGSPSLAVVFGSVCPHRWLLLFHTNRVPGR
jgi:hypothetical protein